MKKWVYGLVSERVWDCRHHIMEDAGNNHSSGTPAKTLCGLQLIRAYDAANLGHQLPCIDCLEAMVVRGAYELHRKPGS